jgi:hypothetical protein
MLSDIYKRCMLSVVMLDVIMLSVIMLNVVAPIFVTLSHFNLSSISATMVTRGRIFSCVRPFYERAVSNLDRSIHRSQWA